jgi:4-amino-4-deoxy-L-arabinose transferase-like glycosyltransferase
MAHCAHFVITIHASRFTHHYLYRFTPSMWTRWDWIILASVTAVGAALRFYQLGDLPPGFQFDEAFNAIDAQQVLAGNFPLFLPANGGREVLYTYWQATLGALFGLNVYTLRLASALAGTLTIPVTYVTLRMMLRQDRRYVAAFTALVLAISLWHVQFSRYGIRVITMPLILSGAFGLFWLGGHATTRTRRTLAYVLSGALVGITPWTHPTGRFVPFILLFYVAWLMLRVPAERRWGRDSLPFGLVITGATAFLVFLPLGLEFIRHPEFFFGHASEVSVFADRVSGGSPVAHFLDNMLHVVGMFSFYGDLDWTHNLAGRPVFDWFVAVPFYLGVGLLAWRLTKRDDEDFAALSLRARGARSGVGGATTRARALVGTGGGWGDFGREHGKYRTRLFRPLCHRPGGLLHLRRRQAGRAHLPGRADRREQGLSLPALGRKACDRLLRTGPHGHRVL